MGKATHARPWAGVKRNFPLEGTGSLSSAISMDLMR
jgi:hypothetical protein